MINIPITLRSDEDGYFDRECPNDKCLYQFKISMEDWENKVSDDEVHCPMCGFIAPSNQWWTQEQLKQQEEIVSSWAANYIQTEMDKAFRGIERSTRGNKYFTVTYKPGRRVSFTNNPIGQMPEWEQKITCDSCGTRYSVIGSAYFCPCCGYNSAKSAFNESIDTIVKMIDSLPQMKDLLATQYGNDKAETMCRSMLEGSLGDCVSAFQKFAEQVYKKLSPSPVRVNDFQIVEKGSNLFLMATGKGYDAWLKADEILILNEYFQKRHLFEHNNGMIDQKYIDKSNDRSFAVGQRMILRSNEVLQVASLLQKLGTGLLTLLPTPLIT